MGYRQTPEYMSGIELLWTNVRKFAGPEVRVEISEWDKNRKSQAEFICRHCADDCEFIHVDYSWGVGYGGVWLAKELGYRGRKVANVVSIDGVYHSDWMPWRAITGPVSNRVFGEPVIWFPDNVQHVDYWRQNIDKWYNPKGHEIRVEGDTLGNKTQFMGFVHRNHSAIDESPEIHNHALWVIENAVKRIAA
jgi:hypothetical protein